VSIDAATATCETRRPPISLRSQRVSSDGTLLAVACRDDQNRLRLRTSPGPAPSRRSSRSRARRRASVALTRPTNTLAVCTSRLGGARSPHRPPNARESAVGGPLRPQQRRDADSDRPTYVPAVLASGLSPTTTELDPVFGIKKDLGPERAGDSTLPAARARQSPHRRFSSHSAEAISDAACAATI